MKGIDIKIECKNIFKRENLDREEFEKKWLELIKQLQKTA